MFKIFVFNLGCIKLYFFYLEGGGVTIILYGIEEYELWVEIGRCNGFVYIVSF